MRTAWRFKVLVGGVGATLLLLGLAPAGASSANISHSYGSATKITLGSLVSLDPLHSTYVVPANSGNGQQLLGIAVAINDSLLAVDPTVGAVQVATSGMANTLVSTINGSIGVGDQISVSPFNGIGMKAASGSHVIGLAQTTFTDHSSGATSEDITDKSGKTTQVKVGYIRLGIAIGTGSLSGDDRLNALQRLAKNITGRTVSTTRVILSLIIALIALIALIPLIYGSIYGGIISIGRNPLAKYAVFRTLASVLGMVSLMVAMAAGTIFLILR